MTTGSPIMIIADRRDVCQSESELSQSESELSRLSWTRTPSGRGPAEARARAAEPGPGPWCCRKPERPRRRVSASESCYYVTAVLLLP